MDFQYSWVNELWSDLVLLITESTLDELVRPMSELIFTWYLAPLIISTGGIFKFLKWINFLDDWNSTEGIFEFLEWMNFDLLYYRGQLN